MWHAICSLPPVQVQKAATCAHATSQRSNGSTPVMVWEGVGLEALNHKPYTSTVTTAQQVSAPSMCVLCHWAAEAHMAPAL